MKAVSKSQVINNYKKKKKHYYSAIEVENF